MWNLNTLVCKYWCKCFYMSLSCSIIWVLRMLKRRICWQLGRRTLGQRMLERRTWVECMLVERKLVGRKLVERKLVEHMQVGRKQV